MYMTFSSFLKLLSFQRTFYQWLDVELNPWSLTSLQSKNRRKSRTTEFVISLNDETQA